ncbi:hypothetical protein MPSEU_000100300 [Mayamaea pseudoterrestris]|nr:hypothetical protein MPSEU_000100300 [Mayamaea pseudoterrestris]
MYCKQPAILAVVSLLLAVSHAFVPLVVSRNRQCRMHLEAEATTSKEKDEIIAVRVYVEGDVQGGYYRCCVVNEASKFRKLNGMMTNPDETDKAEIYVEGKRQFVDGFLRWCKKADKKIGMSQVVSVVKVVEEEPTGLYDSFYCKVKPEN